MFKKIALLLLFPVNIFGMQNRDCVPTRVDCCGNVISGEDHYPYETRLHRSAEEPVVISAGTCLLTTLVCGANGSFWGAQAPWVRALCCGLIYGCGTGVSIALMRPESTHSCLCGHIKNVRYRVGQCWLEQRAAQILHVPASQHMALGTKND